jgi:hypothetical protein
VLEGRRLPCCPSSAGLRRRCPRCAQSADLTARDDRQEFLERHPGGPDIILANASKDVTRLFKPIHPPGTLQEQEGQPAGITKVGRVPALEAGEAELSDEDRRIEEARANMPHIDEMVNLDDFEKVCRDILAKKAWACEFSARARARCVSLGSPVAEGHHLSQITRPARTTRRVSFAREF